MAQRGYAATLAVRENVAEVPGKAQFDAAGRHKASMPSIES